ncbi:MAG: hypothetical protein V2J24_05045 [Pseudomonadales bacterium]|jgi:hypothetical protein|nr:hypothetical protein [Pseudomonadales bacterium]
MSTNQTKNETTNGTTLREASERWGMDPDGLTIEQAFAIGRVAGIREEAQSRPITEERLTHPRRINAAAGDLLAAGRAEEAPEHAQEPAAGVPLTEQSPEQQETACERVAVAEAMLDDMGRKHPPEMWSTDAVRQSLEAARLVDAPEDALVDARKAVTWLEMTHTHFAEHDTDGWCDDAREGLSIILGMVRRKLEIADRHYDGWPNRER